MKQIAEIVGVDTGRSDTVLFKGEGRVMLVVLGVVSRPTATSPAEKQASTKTEESQTADTVS